VARETDTWKEGRFVATLVDSAETTYTINLDIYPPYDYLAEHYTPENLNPARTLCSGGNTCPIVQLDIH
jgi:hypothetical protein